MAIALDSTSSGQDAAGSTITIAHTISGSDRVLVLVVSSQDGVGTPSATYDSVAMTLLVTKNVAGQMASWTFALVAPNTGTHNIVVTKDNLTEYAGMAVSFTGAGGTSATGSNSAGSGNPTITVTTATTGAGYVVTGGAKNGSASGATYTGAGTEFASITGTSNFSFAAYTAFAAGADVTDGWTITSAKWALTGVEVYEVAAATTKGGFFNLMSR